MNVRTFTHADRVFSYTDTVLNIPSAVTQQMIATLDEWGKVYPQEGTFPQTQWGVPTIVARFDGVLSDDNTRFVPYEIESCPLGIGYGAIVSTEFKHSLARFTTGIWPRFSLLVDSAPNTAWDEHLWLPKISFSEALKSDTLLLIRNGVRRNHEEFTREFGPLIPRSVTPLWHRHNKSYGLHFGWWREISYSASHGEDLPWQESFVIKPLFGKQGHDVFAWGEALKGKSTRAQITNALRKNKRMFLQAFIPPMKLNIQEKSYNVMLRPYFGFRPDSRTWEPMGGMWVARPAPNLRLHWASDAISGPLHIEFD